MINWVALCLIAVVYVIARNGDRALPGIIAVYYLATQLWGAKFGIAFVELSKIYDLPGDQYLVFDIGYYLITVAAIFLISSHYKETSKKPIFFAYAAFLLLTIPINATMTIADNHIGLPDWPYVYWGITCVTVDLLAAFTGSDNATGNYIFRAARNSHAVCQRWRDSLRNKGR